MYTQSETYHDGVRRPHLMVAIKPEVTPHRANGIQNRKPLWQIRIAWLIKHIGYIIILSDVVWRMCRCKKSLFNSSFSMDTQMCCGTITTGTLQAVNRFCIIFVCPSGCGAGTPGLCTHTLVSTPPTCPRAKRTHKQHAAAHHETLK